MCLKNDKHPRHCERSEAIQGGLRYSGLPRRFAPRKDGENVMAKQRADQLLVDRGLAESRTRAQALILAGLAFVGDRKIDKAGQQVPEDAEISVKGRDHPWVSRGGIKLDHALTHLGWDVTDAVAIDVGSSTGGFTDEVGRASCRERGGQYV